MQQTFVQSFVLKVTIRNFLCFSCIVHSYWRLVIIGASCVGWYNAHYNFFLQFSSSSDFIMVIPLCLYRKIHEYFILRWGYSSTRLYGSSKALYHIKHLGMLSSCELFVLSPRCFTRASLNLPWIAKQSPQLSHHLIPLRSSLAISNLHHIPRSTSS